MGRQQARHMDDRAVSQFRNILDQYGFPLAGWLVVAVALSSAAIDQDFAFAVYLVSFLYYGLYWRAFAWGVRSFSAFKQDALLLKALSVGALAIVYARQPLDPLSLAVITLGVALNACAAAVLGIDRTYYGIEIAGLPPLRATAFPYSVLSHPMIVGNVLAFGGTLINPSFRDTWWPLASLHVALNLGLLAMELAGPHRQRALKLGGAALLAGVIVTLAALRPWDFSLEAFGNGPP